MLCLALSVCACVWCAVCSSWYCHIHSFLLKEPITEGGRRKKNTATSPPTHAKEKRGKKNRVVIVFVLCSGLVGELCGLAFWRRQDSSVQNDADVASAETAEGFGSLSGHEGKQQTNIAKPILPSFLLLSLLVCILNCTNALGFRVARLWLYTICRVAAGPCLNGFTRSVAWLTL